MVNQLKKNLTIIRNILAWLEEAFLCFLLSGMIILACVQICLRFFFSSGLVWADPLLRYMVLWVGLFGAAVATKQGKHITIDILSHMLPEQYQSWLQALLNLFATGVCCTLTYAAIIFVRDEATYGGRVLLGIPSWGLNLIFPLAFGIISFRFLILTLNNLGFIFFHPPTSD
jgi:TRAP-type C4-dicarboxylate transport system permease small subunit